MAIVLLSVYELELPSGEISFQAWFKDDAKKDMLGAYYVRIEKTDQ